MGLALSNSSLVHLANQQAATATPDIVPSSITISVRRLPQLHIRYRPFYYPRLLGHESFATLNVEAFTPTAAADVFAGAVHAFAMVDAARSIHDILSVPPETLDTVECSHPRKSDAPRTRWFDTKRIRSGWQ
jgi:hypothetical protein